mgnify:CR=1 FL=1
MVTPARNSALFSHLAEALDELPIRFYLSALMLALGVFVDVRQMARDVRAEDIWGIVLYQRSVGGQPDRWRDSPLPERYQHPGEQGSAAGAGGIEGRCVIPPFQAAD